MNLRPKLSLLRSEDVERIISSAYDLLATTGVKIIHAEGASKSSVIMAHQ